MPQLLDVVRQCASGVSLSRTQTTREIRDTLLPALLALRKKTYRKKPGFYESLAAIGFSPATVRQWFHRSHAAAEIETIIEPKHDEDEPNAPTPLPGRDRKSPEELLLEHCDRMADAVLGDKIVYAKKLATEYMRIRDDRSLDPGRGAGIRIEDIR